MSRIRQHLTYANVMATLAVFGVVAGGGAYAASKIGPDDIARNAVHSKHIKSHAVKRAEIDDDAVGRREVLNASLRAHDLSVFTEDGDSTVTMSIPAQTCINNDLDVGGIRPGDRVLLFTKNQEADPQVAGKVFVDSQFATEDNRLPFRACNLGTTDLTNEDVPVNVMVIR